MRQPFLPSNSDCAIAVREVACCLTVIAASGIAAAGIAVFSDIRRNLGQRSVTEVAQIGLIGAAAIVSLLALARLYDECQGKFSR